MKTKRTRSTSRTKMRLNYRLRLLVLCVVYPVFTECSENDIKGTLSSIGVCNSGHFRRVESEGSSFAKLWLRLCLTVLLSIVGCLNIYMTGLTH